MILRAVGSPDIEDLGYFLCDADITIAVRDDDTVRLWVERDADGTVMGSTGFELSQDRGHALIRSVAVAPAGRDARVGSRLAMFAFDQARQAGAERAWFFSRRSGPFWQKLAFTSADRKSHANVLPDTQQVRLFVQTDQLNREVAWPLDLSDLSHWTNGRRGSIRERIPHLRTSR